MPWQVPSQNRAALLEQHSKIAVRLVTRKQVGLLVVWKALRNRSTLIAHVAHGISCKDVLLHLVGLELEPLDPLGRTGLKRNNKRQWKISQPPAQDRKRQKCNT